MMGRRQRFVASKPASPSDSLSIGGGPSTLPITAERPEQTYFLQVVSLIGSWLTFRPPGLFKITPPKHAGETRTRPWRPQAPQSVGVGVGVRVKFLLGQVGPGRHASLTMGITNLQEIFHPAVSPLYRASRVGWTNRWDRTNFLASCCGLQSPSEKPLQAHGERDVRVNRPQVKTPRVYVRFSL